MGVPQGRRPLYVATNNRHKLAELAAMVGGVFDVRAAKDLDPEINWNETGDTFEANARIKADAVRRLTKAAVLADDSGLCVDALGGAPGVYSSRYAGKDGDDQANNTKLLDALKGVPTAKRGARFVCVLWYVDESGQGRAFTGTCPGQILEAPRGGHGFGYDPLFQVDGSGVSMAEMPDDAKNAVSHRRRAVDQWRQSLKNS